MAPRRDDQLLDQILDVVQSITVAYHARRKSERSYVCRPSRPCHPLVLFSRRSDYFVHYTHARSAFYVFFDGKKPKPRDGDYRYWS